MTMSGGNLPIVGAQAQIAGARQFSLDAANVVNSLNKINAATGQVAATSEANLNRSASAYSKFGNSVEDASRRLQLAAQQGANAAKNAEEAHINSLRSLQRANEQWSKQRTKDDVAAQKSKQSLIFTIEQANAATEKIERRIQERAEKQRITIQTKQKKDAENLAFTVQQINDRSAKIQLKTDQDLAKARRKEAESLAFFIEKANRETVRIQERAARDAARRAGSAGGVGGRPPTGIGGLFASGGGGLDRFTNIARGASLQTIALGSALGSLAALFARDLVVAVGRSVGALTQFERILQPAIVFTEATSRQVQEMSDNVLELSRNVALAPGEIARLTSELSKEGTSFEQINTGALKATRNLQTLAAGELSAAQAANVISKALQAYNLTGAEADRVTQAVAGAAQRSAGNFGDYELALKRLTPVAGLLKIPIEEVTTAIALLNNAGLQGEQVGSNLLQLFLRLLTPTKESADIMQTYGINLYDVDGRFIGLANTFKVMNQAFGDQAIALRGLTQAERDQDIASLGMSRSFLAALAIINRGPEAFDETLASIKSFNVDEAVTKFGDTLIDQIRIAFNNVQALGIAFSSDLLGRVKQSVRLLNQELQGLSIPGARGAGQGIGAMLEPLMSGGLDYLEKTVQILAPAFGVLADNIARVFESAGGWEAVGKAIEFLVDMGHRAQEGLALYITGIGTLIGKIPELVPVIGEVVGTIAEIVEGVFTTAADNIASVVNSILDYINELASAVGTDVPGAAQVMGRVFAVVAAGIITAAIMSAKLWHVVGTAIQEVFKAILPIALKFSAELVRLLRIPAEMFIDAFVTAGGVVLQVMQETVLPALATAGEFIVNNIIPPIRDAILTVAGAFGTVIVFIKDRIIDFLKFAANIPIVGEYFNTAAQIVEGASEDIGKLLNNIREGFSQLEIGGINLGEMFANLPDKVLGAISAIAEDVSTTFQGALDFVNSIIPTMESIGEGMGNLFNEIRDSLSQRVIPGLDNWLARLRRVAAGAREVRDAHQGWASAGAVNAAPTKGPPIPELGEPPGESSERFLKHIQELLKGIPALTREMAEYVAELTRADRARLAPIVSALNAQIPLITEILKTKRDILAIEIQIEQVNQQLAALALQQQRVELQARQALLPLDKQLLELRIQNAQVSLAMLPIQQRIEGIDRQIALIQRENLDTARQRLELELEALPIRNSIADIDKRIAETQRTNFDLARQRLISDADIARVNDQIADAQRRMEASHRENFSLTRQRLQLELEVLRIDQQIATVDRRIAELQRENFDSIDSRLRLEYELIGPRERLADIEKVINDLGATNYDLAIARARAQLDEIPIRERIAEIEQQINDTIDERQNLILKREQLIAEAGVAELESQLKIVEDALENLWNQFSLRPTSPATAALVPQIISAEAERERLLAVLRPARQGLEAVEQQQEQLRRTGELARIELELQRVAQEAMLRPILDRIAALEREETAIKARNDLTRLGLERERDALEAIIEPMETILLHMDREEERRRVLNEITINGLNRQKQLLQDLQRPYQDQLNRIYEIGQITELTNQIADTFYQEEIQRLQDILAPLEEKRRALEREQAAYDLRNNLARLGLEQEKAILEAILRPIQDMLDSINREAEAERIRRDIAVLGLEAEKRALEDLLRPLEDVKRSIEQQTATITLQRDLVEAYYERQRLQIEEIRISYELYKNQLEIVRGQEQQRLTQLIQKFADAILASGAFTNAEVQEVIRRMDLWGSEIGRIVNMRLEYQNLVSAVGVGATNFNNLGTAAGNTSSALATFITNSGNVRDRVNEIGQATGAAVGGLDPYATAMANTRDRTGELDDRSYDLRNELINLQNQFAVHSPPALNNYYIPAITTARDRTRDLYDRTFDLRGQLAELQNQFAIGLTNAINQYYVPALNNAKDRTRELKDMIFDLRNQQLTDLQNQFAIGLTNAINQFAVPAMNSIKDSTWYAMANMASLRDRINEAAAAFRNFPRGTVNVSVSGFAEGGIVPGPYNAPRLAIVHGGERVIPTSAGVGPVEPTSVRARSVVNNFNNITYNYNFSASYERYQDPITVDQNLRSVVEMARR